MINDIKLTINNIIISNIEKITNFYQYFTFFQKNFFAALPRRGNAALVVPLATRISLSYICFP